MPNELTAGVAVVGDINTIVAGMVQKATLGVIARANLVGSPALFNEGLPPNARIIGVCVQSPAASNAGTSASITVGFVDGVNHNEILNALDVKAAGTGQGQVTPNTALFPAIAAPHQLQGYYTEAGAASSSGGPWLVAIEFVTI
ncbi:MAG: hypothetical protein JWO59_731 [Chloroflexi bacterium]|nr:hypothetical protein [Chloroflexota bacterium]